MELGKKLSVDSDQLSVERAGAGVGRLTHRMGFSPSTGGLTD